MGFNDIEMLRAQWTELYSKTLPTLAKQRDPAQPRWPVTLDHCFARIILDNTVGRGVLQWTSVINKPAVRNMSESQLREAINLGEKVLNGKADLVELDQVSLKARGKGQNKYKDHDKPGANISRKRPAISEQQSPDSSKRQKQSTLQFLQNSPAAVAEPKQSASPTRDPHAKSTVSTSDPTIILLLDRIAQHHGLTPYRKRLYSTLLSVPLGCYTTYAAMAKYLESSARAVGNGMRNNPFAPDVPCHRVLAADGSIGGFHGHWGKEGKYAGNKVSLLSDEGVKFDSKGKVKGPVFTALRDLSQRNDAKVVSAQ